MILAAEHHQKLQTPSTMQHMAIDYRMRLITAESSRKHLHCIPRIGKFDNWRKILAIIAGTLLEQMMAAAGFRTLGRARRTTAYYGCRARGRHTVAAWRQLHGIGTWESDLKVHTHRHYRFDRIARRNRYSSATIERRERACGRGQYEQKQKSYREYFEAFVQWRPVQQLPAARQLRTRILRWIAPWRRHDSAIGNAIGTPNQPYCYQCVDPY